MERYICVYLVNVEEGEYFHSIQGIAIGQDPRKLVRDVTRDWNSSEIDVTNEDYGPFKPKYFFVHPNFAKGLLNYIPPTKSDYGVSTFAAVDVLVDVCRHFEVKRTTIKDILTKYIGTAVALYEGWHPPSREEIWHRYEEHFMDCEEELTNEIRNSCYTLEEEIEHVIAFYEKDAELYMKRKKI